MPSIVIVGSSNTDMVITAPRIPAPGETILGGSFMVAPGGKGANQAVAAARLGADVTFVARIGMDMFGDEAVRHYSEDGINTQYIVRDSEAPSGIAMIMVDEKGENAISVASGANMHLMPEDVDCAEQGICTADIMVLQLEVPYETVEHAVTQAKQAGIPIILNPAPARTLDAELLQQIDYLTPNEVEAELLTGIQVVDDTTAAEAAHCLLETGVGTVIITLGAQGAWWATEHSSGLILGKTVTAVDTTAAGDAFNGGLAVAIAEERALTEAIQFACCTGALSVTGIGAQPSLPFRAAVDTLYDSCNPIRA